MSHKSHDLLSTFWGIISLYPIRLRIHTATKTKTQRNHQDRSIFFFFILVREVFLNRETFHIPIGPAFTSKNLWSLASQKPRWAKNKSWTAKYQSTIKVTNVPAWDWLTVGMIFFWVQMHRETYLSHLLPLDQVLLTNTEMVNLPWKWSFIYFPLHQYDL
jgi:hypothetical protein